MSSYTKADITPISFLKDRTEVIISPGLVYSLDQRWWGLFVTKQTFYVAFTHLPLPRQWVMASLCARENTLLFEIKIAESKEISIIMEVLMFLTLMWKLRENHKALTDTPQYVCKYHITLIQTSIKASEGCKSVHQTKPIYVLFIVNR